MFRMKWCLLIVGCLLVGACAPQPETKSDTAPAAAPAATTESAPAAEPSAETGSSTTAATQDPPAATGELELTPKNAQIQFIGKHTDDKPDRVGVFTEFTGKASIDPATKSLSAVSVEIPVGSLATAFDKLNDHLKSPDFFDVREYPTARFESTGIAAGEGAAQQVINGKLTLLATTKDVSFPAEVTVDGDALKLVGHLTILRSEFGMNKLLEGVKDEVVINVSIGGPTQLPTAE